MTNIYVGNLSFNTSENDLRDHFAQFGQVKSVKIITDHETKKPRGFAFVEMGYDAEGEEAIKQLDGVALDGRDLKVNTAHEREQR